MSDIFDFAIDFGLTYFEPPTKKKQLSMKEYRTGYVDYYDQTLDPTLGTGISLPRGDDDDEEDKKDSVNISKIATGISDETGESSDATSFSPDDFSFANVHDLKGVPTYGQALSKAGFDDKTPFNIFNTDVYFGGVPRTKEEAKKGFERLFTKEKLASTAVKTAGRFAGLNPLMTSGLMGLATGKTVKDPFGNPSFRPNSFIFGGIHDINMSLHYDNVAQMHAALGTTGPKGFAGYIGGQLVTRGPGKYNYNGTIGNLSQETLSRMEALSRGFVPDTYSYKDETGTAGTPAGNGVYDSRGRYHDINGSYNIGTRTASTSLGKQYGLTTTRVEKILADVRADKKKNLMIEIAKEQAKNFEATQKAQQKVVADRIKETDTKVTDIPSDYGVTSDIYSSAGFDTVTIDFSGDDGDYDPGDDSFDMGFSTRYGGQVGEGMQAGGPAGFIGGPPEKYSDQTTIADDIPLQVREGSFVINAPAVEYAGSDDIADMLRKAYQKAGESIDKSGQRTTIPSREQIDIMISRGEVVVPPKIAKIIGYDRLEKINNRGKKEVARRKKAGDRERPQARQANQGGFIEKAEGDKVTVYRGEPSKFPKRAELLRDKYTGSWFSPNKNFTKTYGEVAKTMELTFDEYKKGAKKAFLKKNISTRRMENRDAKLPPELTRSQRSRIFQSLKYIDFMANEVKRGNRSTKAFVDFMYEGVFPKEKDKATIMLLETAKRSPKAFGKLVVDSLVKNVVSKGIPIVGSITGFAPTEMGDATLSGKEGFIYDYRTIN
mgnify:FL=1